jgi:hypothetical protein
MGDGTWIVVENFGDDDVARAEPFAAIEVALARWWLRACLDSRRPLTEARPG